MKVITIDPPEILQSLNRDILLSPVPFFKDSLDVFDSMLDECLLLWYKLDKCPKKKERCEALKKEILEMYERATVKEKERKSQKNHKTQRFGYFVDVSSPMAQDIYFRLRFSRRKGLFRSKER